jgi:hypothetical protein
MKNTLKILIATLSLLLIFTFESEASFDFNFNQLQNLNFGSDWKESLDLRRGGGFGRSFGRSFGSRRSSFRSTPRSSRSSRPSSGNRSSFRSTPRTSPKAPSFGGNRISSQQAKQRYGVPTKTTPITKQSATGQSTNYIMHGYGGYSSGLMTGYMMGSTSWMWMMPFHPAFYYSRPSYVENADGTVGVYPPTFSWGKLFMTIIVIAVIVYFVRAYFRNKKQLTDSSSQGSFS